MFAWDMPLPIPLPYDFYFDKSGPLIHYSEDFYKERVLPRLNDFMTVKVGPTRGDYDFSWIYNRGDIMIEVKCDDGTFFLIQRKPEPEYQSDSPR